MKMAKTLKKMLAVSLCAVLLTGTAAVLPEMVQDSSIVANADYNGYLPYEIQKQSGDYWYATYGDIYDHYSGESVQWMEWLGIESNHNRNAVAITQYTGNAKSVSLPSTIDGKR